MQERTILLSSNHKLDPTRAKQQIDAYPDITILDVSPTNYFHERHIPNAISIPLADLGEVEIKQLPDKDATIYVISRSEHATDIAVYNMIEQGYTAVFSIGEIECWPYETISS